jgi:hypothetical protein
MNLSKKDAVNEYFVNTEADLVKTDSLWDRIRGIKGKPADFDTIPHDDHKDDEDHKHHEDHKHDLFLQVIMSQSERTDFLCCILMLATEEQKALLPQDTQMILLTKAMYKYAQKCDSLCQSDWEPLNDIQKLQQTDLYQATDLYDELLQRQRKDLYILEAFIYHFTILHKQQSKNNKYFKVLDLFYTTRRPRSKILANRAHATVKQLIKDETELMEQD